MELDTALVLPATGTLFDVNSVFMASCTQAVTWLKKHLPTPETLTAGLRPSLGRAQLLILKAAVKKIRTSSSRHCLSFPWELLLAVLLPFSSAWATLQLCYGQTCTWPWTLLIRVPAPGPQADCPLHSRTCFVTVASCGDHCPPALPALLCLACWAWWICSQAGMAQPLQPGGTYHALPIAHSPCPTPTQSSSAELWSVSPVNICSGSEEHINKTWGIWTARKTETASFITKRNIS